MLWNCHKCGAQLISTNKIVGYASIGGDTLYQIRCPNTKWFFWPCSVKTGEAVTKTGWKHYRSLSGIWV